MASWKTNIKHEPSEINGGNRYETKDRVSREQLNSITENAFYAMAKSDDAKSESSNALSIANEALVQSQKTGTQVNVDGVFQNYLNFTSDPQAQINNKADQSLLDTLDTNKANKDLSNVTYPQIVENGIAQTGAGDRVVESKIYSDGLTWYRKWASGWKECGMTITANSTFTDYTLPITFSNTNYILVSEWNANSSTDPDTNFAGLKIKTKNSYGFTARNIYAGSGSGGFASGQVMVYCCGY